MATTYVVPFQGRVLWSKETAYGTGGGGTLKRYVSSTVNDARLETTDRFIPYHDISKPSAFLMGSVPSDYTLHLEYVLDSVITDKGIASLASMCINRGAAAATFGELSSVSIELVIGLGNTNYTQYNCYGCKCKSITFRGSKGQPVTVAADFSVKGVSTSSTGVTTSPTGLTASPVMFNSAGVALTATGDDAAFITDSFEFTINNNLTDHWDCDSTVKQLCVAGALDITGSTDVSLELAGLTRWGRIDTARYITSLAFTLGTGSYKTFTLNGVKYNNISLDANTDGDIVMSSIPFTAKTIAIT